MTHPSEIPADGYEVRDARVGWVVASVAMLAVGLAACFVVAAVLYPGGTELNRPTGPEMSFRHGAADELSIVRDWRAQDAAVRDHLKNYAWVDRGEGIVRIPVERAMELMVSHPAAELQKKTP
jgi:hypothetical protein